jgi:hypothetical protein
MAIRRATIYHVLDNRVETGHITAAGQDSNSFSWHFSSVAEHNTRNCRVHPIVAVVTTSAKPPHEKADAV